jgi:hypothetical protein
MPHAPYTITKSFADDSGTSAGNTSLLQKGARETSR